MLMKTAPLLMAILSIAVGLGSCGIYSFSPGGKSSIKTIAVSQFRNETVEAGLAGRMTDLVIDAFISDGNLKIASESEADAVLSGTLTRYDREAYTFDENDNVTQYIVKIVFDAVLQKGDSQEEMWKETFYSEGVYAADSESEEDGQSRAASKLVVNIINRTAKSW
jgi:hypothetical protein